MINFLHTFHPQAILITLGPITVYWYGLFMVLAMIIGMTTAIIIAKRYNINPDKIIDLSFYLIIGGLIGARIYEIFLELPYYVSQPLEIIKVWHGGLAVHGAIIGGLITLGLFVWKNQDYNFWKLCAIAVPALALGQAIGRCGNYFNQELFGLPTSLPWGIPIDILNRNNDYISASYFHPTFIYEALGDLLIFGVLILCHYLIIKKRRANVTDEKISYFRSTVLIYIILYSILRFLLEFIRIDVAPVLWGLRWPQIASLSLIFISLIILFLPYVQIIRRQKKAIQ
ncbi:prolipoprotein diacylglyceryl transferase [Candidatus Falkowbacteria bacterium CG10_big_fil_rev_8_21_14_0_10_39_9]|uniref:Phosphatidylglycerol--prolipoprotein diacylglyceryl transferase n=1 Tax=Candidatus Falkowbacteria bacterium CG10_big_fil_rev_8_21_14_0_10_39_9 TaxID=1974566 RepID=A0A2M6WR31_9BACT|nr:MAG: prolipoprotein diacylglyceryl transferase [Candidatus Falkowbacteria bacterium CG10_big_fil_rev_8_21_14_0_10_39_9]